MTRKLHHRAKLSDEAVKAMRAEHLAYVRGYGWLARKWHCGKSTARDIVQYRTRGA
jgi:hypothetical protein